MRARVRCAFRGAGRAVRRGFSLTGFLPCSFPSRVSFGALSRSLAQLGASRYTGGSAGSRRSPGRKSLLQRILCSIPGLGGSAGPWDCGPSKSLHRKSTRVMLFPVWGYPGVGSACCFCYGVRQVLCAHAGFPGRVWSLGVRN